VLSLACPLSAQLAAARVNKIKAIKTVTFLVLKVFSSKQSTELLTL